MTKSFKTLEEFQAEMPKAYDALTASYIEYMEEEVFEDGIVNLIDHVRESAYDHEDDVDSCYITCNYNLKIDNFKFEVVGQSYRKDMSVCEEKMGDEITVTDLTAKKLIKQVTDAAQKIKNLEDWRAFIDNAKPGEIYELLQHIKFPKKK